MRVLLAILLFGGMFWQPQWPTLRNVLAKHQINADDFADADRQISSFAIQDDRDWFAIAYYWHTGTGSLPDELRLRTWDRRLARWRYVEIPGEARRGGSALEIHRRGEVIYLWLHINPSAAQTLVLSDELAVRRPIAGWPSLVLDDGRLVYENNMTHFAPFHPGSVSLYDPRSDREVRLFPASGDPYKTKPATDRSIGTIRQTNADEITFEVVEEDRWWVQGGVMKPIAPERRLIVTCALAPTPACLSKEQK